MRLDGIHHITAITGDAQQAIDYYSGLLGLRFVKKTVNFDDPTAYHLYFGDQQGSPGSILTFFEYPGVPAGRPGAGMIHRLAWRVADGAALDFWQERLARAGVRRPPRGLLTALRRPGGTRARAGRRAGRRRAAARRRRGRSPSGIVCWGSPE